jgi:hypothetical protein
MFLFCLELRYVHSYYHLVPLVCCYCSVGYLSDLVEYSCSSKLECFYRCWCVSLYFIDRWGNIWLYSRTWCPRLNPSVKLHTLYESVVPTRVTVLLGLCNPPSRGCGEPAKPRLLYPLVWIPCCDTVSGKSVLQSRVGSIASDLESWVTCCDKHD